MKLLVGLVVMAFCAYGAFFVDIGDRTLAGHFLDIWRAPVVQKKVAGVRDGMKRELEERLAEAGGKAGRKLARELTPSDELTQQDRDALQDVLKQVQN
jgi:hypothetical protein